MRIQTGCTMVLGIMLATGSMHAQTGASGSTSQGAATSSPTAASASDSSRATTDASSAATGVGSTLPSDKMFVKKAIMGSNGEIDAAKLALQKSSNDQVKQYAQKMIDDHTKMLDDMHQVAQAQNVKYVDRPSPSAMKLHKKLEGLNGTEFDKAYVDGMVKDHHEDEREFKTEISNGKVQPVKDAAQKGLPIIQEHTQMIEGIQKSMKA